MQNSKTEIIKNRDSQIDFLKGICVILIIITHFNWSDEERLNILFPFVIEMVVPIFMILSGYVNALSFNKNNIDLSEAYSVKLVLKKIIQYTVPFIFAFAVEWAN